MKQPVVFKTLDKYIAEHEARFNLLVAFVVFLAFVGIIVTGVTTPEAVLRKMVPGIKSPEIQTHLDRPGDLR